MLSPNLAFILFSEQWLSVNGLVFNLNFVQSAALSALNNVGIKKCNNFMFTLPDSTRTDPTRFFMQLPDPDPTCNFSTRHNTNKIITLSCMWHTWVMKINRSWVSSNSQILTTITSFDDICLFLYLHASWYNISVTFIGKIQGCEKIQRKVVWLSFLTLADF